MEATTITVMLTAEISIVLQVNVSRRRGKRLMKDKIILNDEKSTGHLQLSSNKNLLWKAQAILLMLEELEKGQQSGNMGVTNTGCPFLQVFLHLDSAPTFNSKW